MPHSVQVDAALRNLATALAGVQDAAEIYEVLYALLTAREREALALRWELVRLLEEGMTQRAIAAKLGVSLCKITRGSHELKFGPAGFRKIIRRVAQGQQAVRGARNGD